MADAILIATIVVFFVAAALVVRALGRVADGNADAEADDSEFGQEGRDAAFGGGP